MSTLTDRLIAARVGALEEWQSEHAPAIASHEIDEALAEAFSLWREIVDIWDQASEIRRSQLGHWLAEKAIYARLLRVTEACRDLARVIGYFERGLRFSAKRVEGLLAALQRAVRTGAPSERMQLELDLTKIPPRIPTPE